MTKLDPLARIAQLSARLDDLKAREKVRARKADAHRKIVLGALIIKAGLADESDATILGALLTLRDRIEHYRPAFETKGREVLSADAAKRKERTPPPAASAPVDPVGA